MQPRWIIRPRNILSTPRVLKEALGARRTFAYPETSRHIQTHLPDWSRDFFLTYPPGESVQGTGPAYTQVRSLSSANKAEQRRILSDLGLRVPPTATSILQASTLPTEVERLGYPSRKFIIRPLRHSRGEGWRVTEDPTDFEEGTEYIQAVYPKNHEYRVICVRGVPIITLLKRTPEDLPRSQPWNHSNGSVFLSVNSPDLDRLRRTEFYDRIRSSSLLRHIDLAGIDIMYRRENEYALCEINFCPALTIADNINKVARYVHSLPQER